MTWHEVAKDYVMGGTEFMYVFISNKTLEKGRNRRKLDFLSILVFVYSRKNSAGKSTPYQGWDRAKKICSSTWSRIANLLFCSAVSTSNKTIQTI